MTDQERHEYYQQREKYFWQCDEFKKKLERYCENRRRLILKKWNSND